MDSSWTKHKIAQTTRPAPTRNLHERRHYPDYYLLLEVIPLFGVRDRDRGRDRGQGTGVRDRDGGRGGDRGETGLHFLPTCRSISVLGSVFPFPPGAWSTA